MSNKKGSKFITAIAGTHFVNRDKACVSLGKLVQRLAGGSLKSRKPHSLNAISLTELLKIIVDGVKQRKNDIQATLENTGKTIGHLKRKEIIAGYFHGAMTSIPALGEVAALTGVGFQVISIIQSMDESRRVTLNGSKKHVVRILSGLSFIQSLVLFILLIGAYVANIEYSSTKEELQGMYYVTTFIIAFYETLIDKVLKPTKSILNKKQIKSLESGKLCAVDVEPAYAHIIMTRSKTRNKKARSK